MRLRVAEIDQHPVAHVLGDKAVEAADRLGDGAVVGADQLTQILRVKTGRQRGRADQIAEHHRQLPAFGVGGSRSCRRHGGGRSRWGGYRHTKRSNRVEQPPAITDERDAEVPQVLQRKAWQDVRLDPVLKEGRRIAFKSQTL